MLSLSKKVFFIGRNSSGDFGLNHHKNVDKLTEIDNQQIQRVFMGRDYSIGADETYYNIWSSGTNFSGSCAIGTNERGLEEYTEIKYFKENEIRVERICVGLMGRCTFFISDKGKLYASGKNWVGQLGVELGEKDVYGPTLVEGVQNCIDVSVGENFCVCLCGEICFNNTIEYICIKNREG